MWSVLNWEYKTFAIEEDWHRYFGEDRAKVLIQRPMRWLLQVTKEWKLIWKKNMNIRDAMEIGETGYGQRLNVRDA